MPGQAGERAHIEQRRHAARALGPHQRLDLAEQHAVHVEMHLARARRLQQHEPEREKPGEDDAGRRTRFETRGAAQRRDGERGQQGREHRAHQHGPARARAGDGKAEHDAGQHGMADRVAEQALPPQQQERAEQAAGQPRQRRGEDGRQVELEELAHAPRRFESTMAKPRPTSPASTTAAPVGRPGDCAEA